MKKMWAGLLAALMLTAALPAAAYAIGPGEPVYGGPGDSAPAQNGRVVYAYPGFKGEGPQYGQMVNSFTEPAGPGGVYTQGWRYSPNGWWYQYADGSWPAGGWKCIDSRWYYFEEGGHVKTGWFQENGIWYYLNPVDDGTYGTMRTGWQIIDGKAYYFNASSEGVTGAMLANTTTPDGYQVGADGAMILQP